MLRIAIQNKGQRHKNTPTLLTEAAVKLGFEKRLLLALSRDFPFEILFFRNNDTPQPVANKHTGAESVGNNKPQNLDLITNPDAELIISPPLDSEKQDILHEFILRPKYAFRGENKKHILTNISDEKINKIVEILLRTKRSSITPLTKKRVEFSTLSCFQRNNYKTLSQN